MCDTSDNTQQQITGSSTVAEEPLLDTQQADIDLLAAEIAEAATEEERKSRTPSPDSESRSQDLKSRLHVQDNGEDVDKGLRDKNNEEDSEVEVIDEEGEEEEEESSSDPAVMDMSVIEEEPDSSEEVDDGVMELSMLIQQQRQQQEDDDEAWELVDADDDDPLTHEITDSSTESDITSSLKYIFRKFLTTPEMGDKLLELGLTCDSEQNTSSQAIEMDDSGIEHPSENFLKNLDQSPKITIWKGEFSGAKVCIEGEQKGGLLVADVRLWHKDLLQALTVLKNLANQAGLISYADVDVSSILARAA